MKNQEAILLYSYIGFSILSSFVCVFYAVDVNLSETASQGLKTFAYVVGGYGLMNVYILSAAWNTRAPWAPKANLLIGVCFFAVVIMDMVKDGFNKGLGGIALLTVLALALWLNWTTAKKVCQRKIS